MARKYSQQMPISPDGWTDWIQPITDGYRMSCCDCSLVHEMDFRIHEGRVQLRARRNNRSTGALRRHNREREEK